MKNEKVDLGPGPATRLETYEVTAEWDEKYQRVYLEDWNPYDGHIIAFFGLAPEQMDKLVEWWTKKKKETHE